MTKELWIIEKCGEYVISISTWNSEAFNIFTNITNYTYFLHADSSNYKSYVFAIALGR